MRAEPPGTAVSCSSGRREILQWGHSPALSRAAPTGTPLPAPPDPRLNHPTARSEASRSLCPCPLANLNPGASRNNSQIHQTRMGKGAARAIICLKTKPLCSSLRAAVQRGRGRRLAPASHVLCAAARHRRWVSGVICNRDVVCCNILQSPGVSPADCR